LSKDSNSRSGYRAKRKKTNVVLNTLIVVVLLLIIFVAYNIFSSGNDNASTTSKKESTKTEQTKTTNKEKTTDKEATTDDNTKDDTVSSDDSSSSEDQTAAEQASEETTTPEQPEDTQAGVTDDGSSSATQTGEHKMTFEGEDWQAMLTAISKATGIDQSNMTVNWLGSDKSTANAAIGTVTAKDTKQKFKVYIKWVDGQGYVPTNVEQQ